MITARVRLSILITADSGAGQSSNRAIFDWFFYNLIGEYFESEF